MPSKIYMICNAYESGVGHGQKDDGLPASYGDDDLNEAYHIGYEFGFDKWQKHKQQEQENNQK
jgi:hypothetical protein